MHLKLHRNATLRLSYAGQHILVDPMLGVKHTLPSFAGIEPNPTRELPAPVQEVLEDLDLVLVSHLHPDHFDEAAKTLLPKDLPLLVQPGDEHAFQEAGFTNIHSLNTYFEWKGLSFARTSGEHGSGPILSRMGNVMGFVLRAAGEPTVYWLGDTILTGDVLSTIREQKPDIIVTHSGGAKIAGTLLIMDAEQTLQVAQAAPDARVIAVHMESLDHCTVSRAELRESGKAAGLAEGQLLVPEDGETLVLQQKQTVF